MRSDEKAVRAITGVTAVMLAAKLLAVLRNILQARAFGAGPEMDLFTLANNYSVSLFTTVAHAFCVAAVPIFSQGLRRSREEGFAAANRLISTAMTCCLGLTLLLEGLNLTGLPALLARLASLTVAQRRELAGLHPDRAPTIVAGAGILLESMRVFGLDAIEVSETDILHGAALEAL